MKEIIAMVKKRVREQLGVDRMPKSLLVILFFGAFLAGIFLGDLGFDGEFGKFIFVAGVILAGIFRFLNLDRKVLLVILIGIIFGMLRLNFALMMGETDVSNYEGNVVVSGCVGEQVDVRNDKVKYTLAASEIRKNGEIFEVSGNVLVTGERYPVYEYGDCLVVSGKLEKPGKIENFDYRKYLRRYGIGAVIYRAKIQKIRVNGDLYSGFFEGIFSLKNKFEEKLSRIYAEPYAGFMSGLILGSRRGISEELTLQFNATGLSHIVAISGYNITMLIVVVSGLFGFLGRKKKVLVSVLIIFIFVILVGAGASVVRAAIMGVVGLMALWFGRTYFVNISLFAAAFFMNLANPFILINDVGFQLSFLATCGLVFVSPLIKGFFVRVPEIFGMRESLTMTIAAQVLALPIILFNFGRLSLISPLANILVLPFLPLAMIFGFFGVLFGYVWNFLGLVVGFLGYLILALIIFLVQFFAAMPLASLEIGWFNWWVAGVYYAGVGWWIARKA